MLQNLMIEQGFQNSLANMKGGNVAGPKQPDPMAWAKGDSGGGGMMGMGSMMGGGGKAKANPTPDSRMNMLGRG